MKINSTLSMLILFAIIVTGHCLNESKERPVYKPVAHDSSCFDRYMPPMEVMTFETYPKVLDF